MTPRPLCPSYAPISAAIAAGLLMTACGGGGSTDTPTTPTDGERLAAASQTANSHSLCSAARLGPYYWEVGDARGRIGGGQVGAGGPARDTTMAIASSWPGPPSGPGAAPMSSSTFQNRPDLGSEAP